MNDFPCAFVIQHNFSTKTHQTPSNVNALRPQNFKIRKNASQNHGNAAKIFYFIFQIYFCQWTNEWFLTAVTKCRNNECNAKFCPSYSAQSSDVIHQASWLFSWTEQFELVLVCVTSITSTRLDRCHYPLFGDNCSRAKTNIKQLTSHSDKRSDHNEAIPAFVLGRTQ
jgi:hypothetical protein